MQDYIDKCNKIIAEHGMLIQGVGGEAMLCYTVGLSKIAGVELFVVGVPYETAGAMLNSIRRQYLDGSVTLVEGEILGEVAEGLNLTLKAVGVDEANVFRVAEACLGSMPKFLRLVYPDKGGKFPWDAGCDPKVVKVQSAEFLKTYL